MLLDALEALGTHREAAILVGAHVVYLRVGEGDLATTPYTTDADVALDPALLGATPPLDEALAAAGFVPKIGPDGRIVGSWVTEREVSGMPTLIDLDVLVPAALGGEGRRAARLNAHGDRVARKALGLELALSDNGLMTIGALDADQRSFEVRVAGTAALLVAKAQKIGERLDDPRRDTYIAKDALDILRLLRGSDLDRAASTLAGARTGALATVAPSLGAAIAATVERALALLGDEFARENARGCVLAGRAAAGRDDPGVVAASLAALTSQLLERL